MLELELCLKSQLMRETLSFVLTAAGFDVVNESHGRDEGVTALIDIDGSEHLMVFDAHRLKGDRIVVLTDKVESLKLDDDRTASLSGVLTYDLSTDALVRSLRLICAGGRVIPEGMAPGSGPSALEPRPDGSRLSSCERELLSYLLDGRTNRSIACLLGTSETAARVALAHLLRKLGVDSRMEAAVWTLANLPDCQPARPGFV